MNLLLQLLAYALLNFVRGHGQRLTDTVSTSFGKVRGLLVHPPVAGLKPVQVFLGIPYGAPPTGNNRFMMPQTAAKWTNMEKNATELPPVCIQQFPTYFFDAQRALGKMPQMKYDYITRLMSQLGNEHENCLFMNIYVPVRSGRGPQAPLPILVIVHGESYMWNSGNPYNATILSSYGQIIVITLNYRVGILGFLSSGRASCRGNWGMSDILCALQFLREFISPFGGDPKSITLMGWGTGAAVVNLLMSSPMSAPAESRLFRRAILLGGGSSLSSWAVVDRSSTSENFYRFATNAGCATTKSGSDSKNNNKKNPEFLPEKDILQCIRNRPHFNLTKSAQNISKPSFLSNFGPVVDGIIVSNEPSINLEHHGTLFHDIDLMVGICTNQAFDLLSQKNTLSGIDAAEKKKIYRTLTRNLYKYHLTEIYEAISNEYRNWRDPAEHTLNGRDSVLAALSDALYNTPAIKTARLHARGPKNGAKDSQTYVYVFGHKTQNIDRGTEINEAVSNEDLPYILGYPLLNEGQMRDLPYSNAFTETEKEISEAMMTYVSNFVKKGDPRTPVPLNEDEQNQKIREISRKLNRIGWPRYDDSYDEESFLFLSGEKQRIGRFYRAEKVAFWDKLIPALERTGGDMPVEHNMLPDHFQINEYYGVARPSFHKYTDVPFPPPPLPPTPMPPELATKVREQRKNKNSNQNGPPTTETTNVTGVQYSTILSVTVAVGCALLVLNILIFAGICHQRDKHKRSKKQMQMHYQSYDSAASGAYLNSPIASSGPRMPPAPPPPGTANLQTHSTQQTVDGDLHPTLQGSSTPQGGSRIGTPSTGTAMRTFHQHHHAHHHPMAGLRAPDPNSGRNTGTGYQEQEPLLSGAVTRGVSPTCPRHGRAAMAASHVGPVEEIQV